MAYFTPEFLTFFADLEVNNDRDWFKSHKKQYEAAVKKPFEAFIDVMIDRMQEVDRDVLITPKEAIFRIYRDTRFSKDKTPYKVQVSAAISPGGRKAMDRPGMYIEMSHKHARVYSGVYMPQRPQLQEIREKIITEPERFRKLIAAPDFVRYFGEIRGERNKVLPKEMKPEAEQQPLLFQKQFYYFTQWSPEVALADDLPDQFMDRYRACLDLNTFLFEAVSQADV